MLGRYDEPACKWKQDDLDHSVMLVGYGTTKDAKDYWTVRCSPAHADHHPLAVKLSWSRCCLHRLALPAVS